jgi:hypothetical protein
MKQIKDCVQNATVKHFLLYYIGAAQREPNFSQFFFFQCTRDDNMRRYQNLFLSLSTALHPTHTKTFRVQMNTYGEKKKIFLLGKNLKKNNFELFMLMFTLKKSWYEVALNAFH